MIGRPVYAGPSQSRRPEARQLFLRTLNRNLRIPLIAAKPLLQIAISCRCVHVIPPITSASLSETDIY